MSERRIVALNNAGVTSLCCGRNREAIFSFRHAIACLKSCKEIRNTGGTLGFVESFPPSPVVCRVDTDFGTMSPSNRFEIYHCAFLLPKDVSIMRNFNETAATLAYNCALAIHLVGLHKQDKKLLMEALRYYKLAVSALGSHGVFTHFESNQTGIILGSVTNMGHVYSHFWHVDKAKECCDFLSAIVSSFSSNDPQLNQDDHYFFFCAMAFGAEYTCLLAPAA